jgi:hypothetical protein
MPHSEGSGDRRTAYPIPVHAGNVQEWEFVHPLAGSEANSSNQWK